MAVNWKDDRIADGQVRVSIPGFGIAVTNVDTVMHAMGDLLNTPRSRILELCYEYTGIEYFESNYGGLSTGELIFVLLDAGYEWKQNHHYLSEK